MALPLQPVRSIRLLVAGSSAMDCQLLLTALRRFPRQFEIAASVALKGEILTSFSRKQIDVGLIAEDLEDGRSAGLEILSELHAAHPKTPVVMLLNTSREDTVLHAFCAGAKGVFCRSEKKLDLLSKCIRAVHEGQVWANSDQLQVLLRTLHSMTPRRVLANGRSLLGSRENQVAALVAEGLPNKQIAKKLGITDHTVSNYLFRIYNKLGISSRVELVLYLMKQRGPYSAAS